MAETEVECLVVDSPDSVIDRTEKKHLRCKIGRDFYQEVLAIENQKPTLGKLSELFSLN